MTKQKENKRKPSGLFDHKLEKKKGALVSPFNYELGKSLKFSSWPNERLPEYLWMGLILDYYGRQEGLERVGRILWDISKEVSELDQPKLSSIFSLPQDKQKKTYNIIIRYVKKEVLAPLTVLYTYRNFPHFNKFFMTEQLSVKERIEIIENSLTDFYNHQSQDATDLRFLVISYWIFKGKVKVLDTVPITTQALEEYPYSSHEDEKMSAYRAAIRSLEIGLNLAGDNHKFSHNFWKDIGMITNCEQIFIDYPENTNNYNDFVSGCYEIFQYLINFNKQKLLCCNKFDVLMGSSIYVVKIFDDIIQHKLGNSILGRQAFRTIIEVYITTKFLLLKEEDLPNIWEEYKLYGISRFKLVLLKAREYDFDKRESHLTPKILEILVNEPKWEEFLDVNFKYFSDLSIREKSELVGEKELYDLFYDYDTNFTHGFWGAIRESSMIFCDSVAHKFHSIPDVTCKQKLPDVISDMYELIKRILKLISEIYDIPLGFLEKYNI
jgi:hypothetical protein